MGQGEETRSRRGVRARFDWFCLVLGAERHATTSKVVRAVVGQQRCYLGVDAIWRPVWRHTDNPSICFPAGLWCKVLDILCQDNPTLFNREVINLGIRRTATPEIVVNVLHVKASIKPRIGSPWRKIFVEEELMSRERSGHGGYERSDQLPHRLHL